MGRSQQTIYVNTQPSRYICLKGTPPIGWIDTAFADSGWERPVLGPALDTTGTRHCDSVGYSFWNSSTGNADASIWRDSITYPGDTANFRAHISFVNCKGPITSAEFKIGIDDAFDAYINGNYLGSNPAPVSGADFILTATQLSWFNTSGDNVLAIRAINTTPNCAALDVIVIVQTTCTALGVINLNSEANGNKLMQNAPNPFINESTILYILNSGTSAYIEVTTIEGKVVKHTDLSAKGEGSITISGGELNAGTYTYTLYVDHRATGTKLMTLIGQ